MKIDHIECLNLLFNCPNRWGFQSSGGIRPSRVTSLILVPTDQKQIGIGSVYSHPTLVQILLRRLSALRGYGTEKIETIWKKRYGWYSDMVFGQADNQPAGHYRERT